MPDGAVDAAKNMPPETAMAATRDKFVSIGTDVYILRPAEGSRPSEDGSNTDPDVILVFGWMGAKLPHLQKYTSVYEKMFPGSTQILVRCEPNFFWSLERTRRRRIVPAIKALETLGYITNTKTSGTGNGSAKVMNQPRILMHSFSNGGALQMTILSELLRSRGFTSPARQNDPEKPVSAIIIDSSPGSLSFQGALKAFTMSHPQHPALHIPVTLLITLVYAFGIISIRIFRIKPLFERMCDVLLSKKAFPWVDGSTPRLYVYSKTDALISWRDVEEHVERARREGLDARTDVYKESPHVAHARSDPSRYWGKVKELWASMSD